VATAIREAREKAGLSQESAARSLGVSSQTVYRWEAGSTVKDRDLAAMERLYKADFSGLYKMVPRGTSADGADEPRFPFAMVIRTPAVRQRLAALRAELIGLGADEEREERIMAGFRDRQRVNQFVGGREEDAYTEREVLAAIDNYARVARDIIGVIG